MPYKFIYEPGAEATDVGMSKVIIEFGENQGLGEMFTHYERFLSACGFKIEEGSLEVREDETP